MASEANPCRQPHVPPGQWREVAGELADTLRNDNATVSIEDGPWGRELYGVTPNAVKIAWLLARSPQMVPIPGTLSIEHLRENIAALEIDLAEDENEALSAGD